MTSRRAGTTLLAGIATAGAILVAAPTASAEPDQNCPPPEAQSSEQQPCEKQQGQGMPDLPDLPRNDQNAGHENGRLSDINCWMYPTGPVWVPLGAAPPPAPVGVSVPPCYFALGMSPTMPGR